MAYVIRDVDHRHLGTSVGSGQCVALVQAWGHVPLTATWRAGEKVKGNTYIDKGTVIATMVDGHYPNHAHGNHAAIYLGQDHTGIQVIDQWSGQVSHRRTIHFNGGHGSPSNDGDKFYVVE